MVQKFMLSQIVFCALVFFAGQPGFAQGVFFDAGQWGNANLVARQSAGGTTLESIVSSNDNMERLNNYNADERLRKMSRPVGRLDIRFADGQFSTCTATLITRDRIITNHHCVPNLHSTLDLKGGITDVTLLMNHYDERNTQDTKAYRVGPIPVESDEALDYAILQVEGAPGDVWGTATVRRAPPRPGAGLLVIHHPGGLPKHVTRGQCRAARPATDSVGTQLFHLCDTLPGSSGAPIFADSDGAMIGIHRAGPAVVSADSTNFGILMAAMDTITQFVVLQGQVETSLPMLRRDIFVSDKTFHLGDENIRDWEALLGGCLKMPIAPAPERLAGVTVTAQVYGAENTSLVIGGAIRPFFNQKPPPNRERPNFWSDTVEVVASLPRGIPAPDAIEICSNEVPNPEKPGELDDFRIRNIKIVGTFEQN